MGEICNEYLYIETPPLGNDLHLTEVARNSLNATAHFLVRSGIVEVGIKSPSLVRSAPFRIGDARRYRAMPRLDADRGLLRCHNVVKKIRIEEYFEFPWLMGNC